MPRPRQIAAALRASAATAVTLAAVALAAAIVVPALLGLHRYVITSYSMTGTYDRGSVVYGKVVPVADLRVGDIITYTPPAGAGPRGLVTHRIVAISRGADGKRTFRTQGDANPAPDPWVFNLDHPTQARDVAHLPYLGYGLAALSDRQVRMALVGLPAILIALFVVASTWRDAGAEARTRRRDGAPSAEAGTT